MFPVRLLALVPHPTPHSLVVTHFLLERRGMGLVCQVGLQAALDIDAGALSSDPVIADVGSGCIDSSFVPP